MNNSLAGSNYPKIVSHIILLSSPIVLHVLKTLLQLETLEELLHLQGLEYFDLTLLDWVKVKEILKTQTSLDRKSTRLNSSHVRISYAVFCLKKKTTQPIRPP